MTYLSFPCRGSNRDSEKRDSPLLSKKGDFTIYKETAAVDISSCTPKSDEA